LLLAVHATSELPMSPRRARLRGALPEFNRFRPVCGEGVVWTNCSHIGHFVSFALPMIAAVFRLGSGNLDADCRVTPSRSG
jgi:hypothetical protein